MGFVRDDEYWMGTSDPVANKKTEAESSSSSAPSRNTASSLVPLACRARYDGEQELRFISRDISRIRLIERNKVAAVPAVKIPTVQEMDEDTFGPLAVDPARASHRSSTVSKMGEDADRLTADWANKVATVSKMGEDAGHLTVDWANHPDRYWKPKQSIPNENHCGVGDDSDDSDHLDHGDSTGGVGFAGKSKAGDINGFEYDPKKYRPRRDRSGGLVYSSFIPPIPTKVPPSTYARATLETVTESPETIQARILENMRNSRYFEKDQPILIVPESTFNVKFIGMTLESCCILKFLDRINQAHYTHLQQSLGMYFSSKSCARNIVMPVEEMEKGRIVLAEIDQIKYIRGIIVRVNHDDGTVVVRNCDEWEHATVPIESISYMHPHFMEIPFMVQTCKLKGLNFWCNSRVLAEIAPMLPAVEDVMRVIESEIDSVENVPVVLLQTKLKHKKPGVDSDEPILFNDMFLNYIKGFTRIPKTFIRGVILEKAHVSIIEDNGEVWIQMHSELSSRLSAIGENPEKCMVHYPEIFCSKRGISDFEHSYFNLKNERFLARFNDDRSFYRVEVLGVDQKSKKAKVRYLEFGNTETISTDDVIPTAFVDPILNEIPSQVFRAVLNGIDSIVDADEFFNYIGVSTKQRFVVAGLDRPGVPILELHAQLDPQDPEKFVFVNQFILEKGIATGPGVRNPMPIRAYTSKGSAGNENPAAQRMWERRRFLSSCRILEEEA